MRPKHLRRHQRFGFKGSNFVTPAKKSLFRAKVSAESADSQVENGIW